MGRSRSALTPAQRMKKRRREKKAKLEELEKKFSSFLKRASYEDNAELVAEMRASGMSFIAPDDHAFLAAALKELQEVRKALKLPTASSEDDSDATTHLASPDNSGNAISDNETSNECHDNVKRPLLSLEPISNEYEDEDDNRNGNAANNEFDYVDNGNQIDSLTFEEQEELATRTFPQPKPIHEKRRRYEEILQAGEEYMARELPDNSAHLKPSDGMDAFQSYRAGPTYQPTRASYAQPSYLFSAPPELVRERDAYFYDRYYMPSKKARVEVTAEQVMNVNLMEAARNYDDSMRGTFHLDDLSEREELTREMLQDESLLFEDDATLLETAQDKFARRHDYTFKKHDDHERYLQDDADDEGGDEADEEDPDLRIDMLLGTVSIDEDMPLTLSSHNDNGSSTSDVDDVEVDDLDISQTSSLDVQGDVQGFEQSEAQNDYHFSRADKTYSEICDDYLREMQQGSEKERNDYLEKSFMSECSKLNMSERASRVMWDRMRAVRNNYPFNRKLPCYQTIRSKLLRCTPYITMKFEIRKKDGTGPRFYYTGDKYPQKKFPRCQYEILSVWTSSTIEEVYLFHKMLHNESTRGEPYMASYDLCMDGVPLSVSGIDQMTILCVRFEECQEVYELGIFIHRKGKETCVLKMLQECIKTAYSQCFYLKQFIADAPMRAKVKALKGHNGFCSCDRCFASGVTLKKRMADSDGTRKRRRSDNEDDEDDIEAKLQKRIKLAAEEKRGSNVLFPKNTVGIKRRTHSHFLDVYDKLRDRPRNKPLGDKVAFGIKGISVLIEDPGVDLVENVDIDPFHNLGLGMAKKIINCVVQPRGGEEMFSRANKQIVDAFDSEWSELQIPCEFNRRPRKMATSLVHYKAEEFISIATCGFLAFANACRGVHNKLIRQVWLLFTYLTMAALLPQQEYDNLLVARVHLEQLHRTFYDLFQRAFKLKNCTYNTHVFYHLPEVRKKKRLDEISSEPFEASFQYIKKIITNNTCSFSKTVMQKCFINKFCAHKCKKTVYISNKNRMSKSNDMTVYARSNGRRDFFEVIEVTPERYICHPYTTERFYHDDVPMLNYDAIGVRRKVNLEKDEIVEIMKNDVIGKGVHYRSVLINVSFSTLHM